MTKKIENSFATAISCIDGRAHAPVEAWLQAQYGAAFIDRVTEPGPDMLLANGAPEITEAIRRTVHLSVHAHKSMAIAVAGHFDCAANPASYSEHIAQIKAAVLRVSSWEFGVPVVGLWVNKEWEVEVVVGLTGVDS